MNNSSTHLEEIERFEHIHAIEKMPEIFDYRFLEGKEDSTIREEGKGELSKDEVGSIQSRTKKKNDKQMHSILSQKKVVFKRVGENGNVKLMYVGFPTPAVSFPNMGQTSIISAIKSISPIQQKVKN